MKRVLIHFLLAIGFALIPKFIVEIYVKLNPNAGWEFLSIFYISILIVQFLYYYLTSNYNFVLTSLSFIINFILWTAEQVNLESGFHDSWFYQKNNHNGVIILGGILWATNKLILDWIYRNRNVKSKTSIVEKLANLNTASAQKPEY